MLATKRCLINKLAGTDYIDVLRLYRNEEVRRFLGGTVEETQFRAKFKDMLAVTDDMYHWVVRDKQSADFMGLISLDTYHDGINIEVSYQFLPTYWGGGYATEVITKVLEYALHELKLPKVVAETQTANERSCSLLKRVGMSLEATVMRFGAEQSVFSISKGVSTMDGMFIRDAQEEDYSNIVRLNDSEVEHTSAMDLDRLRYLASLSSYFRVAEAQERVVAFLLAMQTGAPYHNANFSWFSSRYDSFLYIDRIVVGRDFQGSGIGSLLYQDVFAFAKEANIPRLTCEINTVPPNKPSVAFHSKHGFTVVGSQWLECGKKKVSMQVAPVHGLVGQTSKRMD